MIIPAPRLHLIFDSWLWTSATQRYRKRAHILVNLRDSNAAIAPPINQAVLELRTN